jgi:hypothetical protein
MDPAFIKKIHTCLEFGVKFGIRYEIASDERTLYKTGTDIKKTGLSEEHYA